MFIYFRVKVSLPLVWRLLLETWLRTEAGLLTVTFSFTIGDLTVSVLTAVSLNEARASLETEREILVAMFLNISEINLSKADLK